jgi:hypothetical protein
MFNTEEEELRFLRWAEALHDFRLTDVPVYVWKTVIDFDRFGRPKPRRRKVFSHYVVTGSGPGIDEPTEEELDRVLTAPCKYRKAGPNAPT